MRFSSILSFLVFAPLSCAQSQNGTEILASAVENLPPCALKCTLTIVASSTCELTDIECIKGDEKLLDDLSKCVKSSCKPKEALIARLPFFGGNWGYDDWVMTAAIILIIPLTICAYLLNRLGMGTDMWLVSFENITEILEIFYYTELLYLTSIALTKIAVLLFYLRIFPHRGLRSGIKITIVFCILYIIAFVTATALQCIPIRIAWEHWDGEHHGKCINLNADAWASAAVNIILDLVVIMLPMRELSKLAMSRRRKFGVMLMFLGGGFILRLKYMIQFAQTDNVTWDYLPIGYWSAVEAHVGVVIACLPAIRQLQRSIRERIWPKPKTANSNYYEDNSKDGSKKNGSKGLGSRIWLSKAERSQLSTLGRSKLDKEDFVRLNEYEMGARGAGNKNAVIAVGDPTQNGSDGSLDRSFKSNEDVQPLAATAAPVIGSPVVGSPFGFDVIGQSAYTCTINRGSGS
ncbi:cfem domain-containing protein [Stemphylium lycopersici]|uniref:Cfem domain-containing protein n=1 Tax=Stemphylium lycopersici TaxID=183478 RepID=A0A364MTB9_STELY|nr:cfem domain-containing protein [Stemphylium lycopersici]RAR01989.1 cfem domain-containing protein [Stemphylium lycopersici]